MVQLLRPIPSLQSGDAQGILAKVVSPGFPREVQNVVKDLSFDGLKLFAENTNESLNTLKDSRDALHFLGSCK